MYNFKLICLVIFLFELHETRSQISDKRLCANENCTKAISLAKTILRYSSPDRRILSFAQNVDVTVYSKSAGSNMDLWGIEVNGKRGYAPKKFLRETKVLTKELPHLLDTELTQEQVPLNDSDKQNVENVEEAITASKTLKFDVFDGTTIPPEDISPTTTENIAKATATPGSNENTDGNDSDIDEKVAATETEPLELDQNMKGDSNLEDNAKLESVDGNDGKDIPMVAKESVDESNVNNNFSSLSNFWTNKNEKEDVNLDKDDYDDGEDEIDAEDESEEDEDDSEDNHDSHDENADIGEVSKPNDINTDDPVKSRQLLSKDVSNESEPKKVNVQSDVNPVPVLNIDEAASRDNINEQEAITETTVTKMPPVEIPLPLDDYTMTPTPVENNDVLPTNVGSSNIDDNKLLSDQNETIKKTSDILNENLGNNLENKEDISNINEISKGASEPNSNEINEENQNDASVSVEIESTPVDANSEMDNSNNVLDNNEAVINKPPENTETSLAESLNVSPEHVDAPLQNLDVTTENGNSLLENSPGFLNGIYSNFFGNSNTGNIAENINPQQQESQSSISENVTEEPSQNIDENAGQEKKEFEKDVHDTVAMTHEEKELNSLEEVKPSQLEIDNTSEQPKTETKDDVKSDLVEDVRQNIVENLDQKVEEENEKNEQQNLEETVEQKSEEENEENEQEVAQNLEKKLEENLKNEQNVVENLDQKVEEENKKNEEQNLEKNVEPKFEEDNAKTEQNVAEILEQKLDEENQHKHVETAFDYSLSKNSLEHASCPVDGDCPFDISAIEKQLEMEEAVSAYTDFLNLVTVLTITGLSVVVFMLGYISIDKNRKEGPLIAKINTLEKALLVASKENELLAHRAQENQDYENDRISNEELVSMQQANQELLFTKAALEDQIQSLENQVQNLEKELENSTEVGLELNKMLTDMLSSQNGNETLIANVEQLQRQLVEQQGTINSINDTLNLKDTENHELQLELEIKNKKVTHLQAELDKMAMNLFKVEEDKEQMQAKLEGEIIELKDHLEMIRNSFNSTRTKLLDEINSLKTKYSEVQRNLELKINEYTILKDNFNQIQAIKNNTEALESLLNASSMKAELQQLQRENNSLNEVLRQEQQTKFTLEKQVEIALQEAQSYRTKYDESDKAKLEAFTKLEVLSNYFKEKETQLQKELSKQESLWLERQGEATSTVERIKYMQEELQNYKSQNESLKQEIVSQEVALKSQITLLEKKAHENWVTARQAERRLEDAKQEAAQLRNRLTMKERTFIEDKGQNRIQSPLEQNGDVGISPLHMPVESPASPPLLYGTRDHLTTSPPIPNLPPFLPPPPGVPFIPPPIPGVPGFMPPPPSMFPVDHRPPPLGRMSSPPPPLNSRYSPDSRYSPYDRNSPSPPYDDDYGPSHPPLHRGYSPYNNRDDRRDYKRPPPGRTNGRNKGAISSGSGNSNESLEKINRHHSKV